MASWSRRHKNEINSDKDATTTYDVTLDQDNGTNCLEVTQIKRKKNPKNSTTKLQKLRYKWKAVNSQATILFTEIRKLGVFPVN